MATTLRDSDSKGLYGQPCAWPTLESLEDAMRKARRTVSDARIATEDFVAGTSLEVRRHPLSAIGIAASAGIVTGCVFGVAAGWFLGSRR